MEDIRFMPVGDVFSLVILNKPGSQSITSRTVVAWNLSCILANSSGVCGHSLLCSNIQKTSATEDTMPCAERWEKEREKTQKRMKRWLCFLRPFSFFSLFFFLRAPHILALLPSPFFFGGPTSYFSRQMVPMPAADETTGTLEMLCCAMTFTTSTTDMLLGTEMSGRVAGSATAANEVDRNLLVRMPWGTKRRQCNARQQLADSRYPHRRI